MNYKVVFTIFCLFLSYSIQLNLVMDPVNPVTITNAGTTLATAINTNTNNVLGAKIAIKFSFPTGLLNGLGPRGLSSPGLAFKQFIGVQFPSTVGTTDLTLDAASSNLKYSCALTDGTNTFLMTPVPSVTDPAVSTLAAENNIAYCRLDEPTVSLVPLKTGPAITYTLTITLLTVKISSLFVRNIGLFTSTSNNQEKMIIDSNPVVGNIAQYGDIIGNSFRPLDVTSVPAITVTTGPSAAASQTILYPFNTFDLVLTIKVNSFISYTDHSIVIRYPIDTVTPPNVVSSTAISTTDATAKIFAGTLAISSFTGTNAFAITGFTEDLIPGRTFLINLRGWKTLDTNVGTPKPLEVIVYYKNTYSVFSYYSATTIFSVIKSSLTLTANHPEFWDIYKTGAWPIAFSFISNSDLSNGGYVVIQHNPVYSLTNGNVMTFIASTCDFSGNDSSFAQTFGKRPACFALRTDGISTAGSGIFFNMAAITGGKKYTVTVWAFADDCGGTVKNWVGNANSKVVPSFTVNIYKYINPLVQHEFRFTTMQTGSAAQQTLGSSNATPFTGNCWNTFVQNSLVPVTETFNFLAIDVQANVVTAGAVSASGGLFYKEVTDWQLGVWVSGTTADLASSTIAAAYLYPSSTNPSAIGSYFLAKVLVQRSPGVDLVANYIPAPLTYSPTTYTGMTGRLVYQFSYQWFSTVDGASSACYASWGAWEPSNSATLTTQNRLIFTTTTTYASNGNNWISNNVSPVTIDSSSVYTVAAPTSSANIVRIISAYNSQSSPTWLYLPDSTKDTISAVHASNPFAVAFATNCYKWAALPTTVKSIFTYIDIQIQWIYMNSAATVVGAQPATNTRLIKLYPEGGVVNDFLKAGTPAVGTNPFTNHVSYLTLHNGVCLLEIDGTQFGTDTVSNAVILWFFGATFLESDYSDASATYPVGNLLGTAYGLQSGVPTYSGTVGQFTNLVFGYDAASSATSTALLPIAKAVTTAASLYKTNYIFYLGSVLILNGISSNAISTANGASQLNLLIPYYCPIYTSTTTTGATNQTGQFNNFPTAIVQWLTMGDHATVGTVNKYLSWQTSGNAFQVLLVNRLGIKAPTAAGTIRPATLKWDPYTTTTDSTQIYIYNGNLATAGAGTYSCTGYTLLLDKSITFDTTVSYNGGVASQSNGKYTKATTFYALAKPFQNAAFAGTIAATATQPIAATAPNSAATTTNFFRGIKRPTVDVFTINDKVGFFCASLLIAEIDVLSNYYGTAPNGFFLVDWNPVLTGTAWVISATSLVSDITEINKADPAGNFRFGFTSNVGLPANSVVSVTATGNIGANSICGFVNTLKYSPNTITGECDTTSPPIVKCTIPVLTTSMSICCYNVILTDTITIGGLTVTAPKSTIDTTPNSTSGGVILNAVTSLTSTPITLTTGNASAVAAVSAVVSSVSYSHVSQDGGFGKATFAVTLPRLPTRDMKLYIYSDLSGMLIQGTGNIPRCYASFTSGQYGSNFDSGDILIDTCSTASFSSTQPITIIFKKMVYKCGVTFSSKVLYITIWPIVQINYSLSTVTNTFRVTLFIGSNTDAIAANVSTTTAVSLLTPVTTKPSFVLQYDTLCAVSKVYPKLPGEPLADYQFDFDLDTNKLVITGTTPNEVTIFWPYGWYGSHIREVACYYLSTMLNCLFTDDGILTIKFSSTLSIGSGTKISVTIVNVPNPQIDQDYSFPCTVNSFNPLTNSRTNIITGSGKLAGGIPITSIGTTTGSEGTLRYFYYPFSAVSSANPRTTSTHNFRISFDIAVGLNALPIIISNTPVIHIYFPTDYHLAWYTSKPSATIDEYTSDSSGNITKTSTITPATVVASGNRVSITLSSTSYTWNAIATGSTGAFRYWDIHISNINNPLDNTNTSTPTVLQTTRPFFITLTNSNYSSVFRTATNINTYSADLQTTPSVPFYLTNARGIAFAFDNTKWVVDINYSGSTFNYVYVKPGRYLQAYMSIKTNNLNTILPAKANISLVDNTFSLLNNLSYLVPSANQAPIPFMIGTKCGTAYGFFVVNFAIDNTTSFTNLNPIIAIVDSSTRGVISIQGQTNYPVGSTAWMGILLSDVNYDAFTITWTAASNNKNDPGVTLGPAVVPAGSITPSSSSSVISPIYSIFQMTTTSTTLLTQTFTTTDPNYCFTWSSGQTTLYQFTLTIANVNTAPPAVTTLTISQFTYFSSATDTTLPKNSIRIRYVPTISPIFIYCALVCINQSYPADSVIMAPQTLVNTPLVQYYYNYITSSSSALDIVFNGLVRGQQYHLRCIISSANTAAASVTTSNLSIESFTLSATNSTAVNIIPTPTNPTQCAVYNLLADPGVAARTAMVAYCQKIYSAPGWSANGCVICETPRGEYIADGLFLPNTTCTASATKTKLRFLQSERKLQTTAAATGTVAVPTTFTVCAFPHTICPTDNAGTSLFTDYFNSWTSDLKTAQNFIEKLGISGVQINATVPFTVTTDATIPVTSLVGTSITGAATGLASFTVSNPTNVYCQWQIAPSTAAPASYNAILTNADKVWSGSVLATATPNTVSIPASSKTFTAGTQYNIYIACANDVPGSTKFTGVSTLGSFTIPSAPAPTPTVVSNTTASTFINISILVLLSVYALLF